MQTQGLLPEKLYQKILKTVPVPTVELVIVWKGKFLLGKRKNKPAKGKWFIPGGRIYKGETFREAVLRKALEETGLKVKIVRSLGAQEILTKDGWLDIPTHVIGTGFLLNPLSKSPDPKKDAQHGEFKWFSKINKKWHPYQKNFLKLAGFR